MLEGMAEADFQTRREEKRSLLQSTTLSSHHADPGLSWEEQNENAIADAPHEIEIATPQQGCSCEHLQLKWSSCALVTGFVVVVVASVTAVARTLLVPSEVLRAQLLPEDVKICDGTEQACWLLTLPGQSCADRCGSAGDVDAELTVTDSSNPAVALALATQYLSAPRPPFDDALVGCGHSDVNFPYGGMVVFDTLASAWACTEDKESADRTNFMHAQPADRSPCVCVHEEDALRATGWDYVRMLIEGVGGGLAVLGVVWLLGRAADEHGKPFMNEFVNWAKAELNELKKCIRPQQESAAATEAEATVAEAITEALDDDRTHPDFATEPLGVVGKIKVLALTGCLPLFDVITDCARPAAALRLLSPPCLTFG